MHSPWCFKWRIPILFYDIEVRTKGKGMIKKSSVCESYSQFSFEHEMLVFRKSTNCPKAVLPQPKRTSSFYQCHKQNVSALNLAIIWLRITTSLPRGYVRQLNSLNFELQWKAWSSIFRNSKPSFVKLEARYFFGLESCWKHYRKLRRHAMPPLLK